MSEPARPPMGGGPHWGRLTREQRRQFGEAMWMHRHEQWTAWHGGSPPPEWRMPRWASLWIPVIVSFMVQVPVAITFVRLFQLSQTQGLITIAIALLGPLALIGARRFPGPVVAVTAIGA